MGAVTPILGLYKPGGGSSGTITPDEIADIDRLNGNADLIDAWAGGINGQTTVATPAESVTGVILNRMLAPGSFTHKTATDAEADAATSTQKFVTPALVKRMSPYLGSVTKTSGNTTSSGAESLISSLSLAVTVPRAGRVRVNILLTTFSGALDDTLLVKLKEGATSLADFTVQPNSSNTVPATASSQYLSVILPAVTAGAHTYTVSIARSAGSGTSTVITSALTPAQLSAEMMD